MSSTTAYRFGRFEVRPAEHRVLADGEPAALGARAFDLLIALIERRDRVVPADELFDLIWPGVVVEENNLRQQVSALRKLLGAQAVVTVPGRGYRFGFDLDEATRGEPVAAGTHNLPLRPYALIGRESELDEVTRLLKTTRLLTIVGAGGVGKTRLSLEVADRVRDAYRDGAWFVELAALADPSLVPGVVADVLGVHEEPSRALQDTLLDFLRRRRLLIVLDNCEHLIEATARFAEAVLAASADTQILATSREPMAIAAESAWPLPTLRAPEAGVDEAPPALLQYAAVRLFAQRAAAVAPGFDLTAGNAAPVALICRQLDGIPLALELAAARVPTMGVEQIAERLDDRFRLLTRGSRTAMPRHQTLASLVDWSHDLLSPSERALLRRLSVFSGGWTLGAAEAVCGGDGLSADELLDVLTGLVDKSLASFGDTAAAPRYRMLETIRQYGWNKLEEAGEADDCRSRHLRWMVEFAEGARNHLTSADQLRWHAKADAELENLRAALAWSLASSRSESGLRICNALHRYWYKNMHWREIVGWIDRLGAAAPATPHRARSLYVGAMLAFNFDPARARALSEECLAMSRSLNFPDGIATALMWLAYIDTGRRDERTRALFTESLAVARTIDDEWKAALTALLTLICHAGYEARMGRDDTAAKLLADCEVEIEKVGGDRLYVGHCRAILGNMAMRRGDLAQAGIHLDEALALYREVDSRFDVSGALSQQGFLARRQGDPEQALSLFQQSLPVYRNYPMSQWVTKGLSHLVIAHATCEHWEVAARLAAVLDRDGSTDELPRAPPPELAGLIAREYQEALDAIRKTLSPDALRVEIRLGHDMSREQAIELALAAP